MLKNLDKKRSTLIKINKKDNKKIHGRNKSD